MTRVRTPEIDPAEQTFIERFGLAFQSEHLPRIAGRIFALMLIEGGPLGFDAIAGRLRISRASVSTNARLLESLGILERTALPGDRRDYFRISDSPGRRMLETATARMRRTGEIVADMQRDLAARRPDATARLARMGRFYEVTIRNIRSALAELDADAK